MGRVCISEDKTYFVKDGKPFFYLADTAWMAFEKLSLKEWKEYVYKRRSQGFNVIQISVLPIAHDNSDGETVSSPFSRMEDGKPDFFRYEEAYFDKAERMLQILSDADMIPCLHLLWANYIPDTWAAALSPDTVMPFSAVAPFVKYVVCRYRKFRPVYSVTGDTAFETEQVVSYYQEALRVLKETDPEGIATMHLQPGAELPNVFLKDSRLDFYSYQGGHFQEKQSNNVDFAEYFCGLQPVRPVINSEPPYEGHGWGFRYGRFDAFAVRKAVWHSILSGAKAGVGYGAHGVWMFHSPGLVFNNRTFSDLPYSWHTALEFEGAWDVGFAKWICENYGFYRLRPAKLVTKNADMIRTAMSPEEDLIAVYVPYSTEVEVKKNLEDYDGIAVDLQRKHVLRPLVSCGESSILAMQDICGDVLYIFRTKNGL